MKKFRNFVVAIAATTGLALGGLTVAAPAAYADDTPKLEQAAADQATTSADEEPETEVEVVTEGDTEFTFTTEVSAESSVRVKAYASGKAAVDSRGRLILSFIMPGGLPESQQRRCDTIPAGKKYVNDYYDSNGKRRWVTKTAPPGGVKICFDGKVWRVVKCGNVVKRKITPQVRASLFKGKWTERRRQKIFSEAEAKAEGTSHSAVRAVQVAGPCRGSEASASADGSFFAYARARAWAWSKRRSMIAIQGEIRRLDLQQTTHDEAKVKAKAIAKGSAHTKVSAKIVCNVPPPPPPPPTDRPPVINIYGAPAHLFVGGNAALWIEASDPDNDTLQVSVRAAGQGDTCEPGANCVTGLIPVNVRWDGTPCPTGVKCYRATAWAGDTPGTFTAIATVTANGESAEDRVSFPVVADEF